MKVCKLIRMEKKANDLLISIGIYPNKRGYSYLKSVVLMDEVFGANERLKYIALQEKAKTMTVERDIRVAINNSYNLGKLEFINELLGSNICNKSFRPTSKEIIALLSDFINKGK